MAAYCWVDGSSHLLCTQGSATNPTLGNEYGRTLVYFISDISEPEVTE